MNKRVAFLASVFGLAGVVSVGCSDEPSSPTNVAGAGGAAGGAGEGGSIDNAGSGNESGSAGDDGQAGATDQGGAGGEGGSSGGAGGEGGEGPKYSAQQIERGTLIVRSLSQCGSCHSVAATSTTPAGPELGGNPAFFSNLGAPNLTNDPSGIGDFSDQQVIDAFRDGIALRKENDVDRHLNAIMPYWLFHNMSDADALATVAFLRSVPPAAAAVVTGKADALPVTPPLDPSTLPSSSLAPTDADYAAAQQGKYLLSGVAQCIKCHSPASGRLPIPDFFSGVPPATATTIFAPNITPDVDTGIGGWLAADVVTALKVGTNKLGRTLCGSMPSGAKGYGAMTDADAHAIAVYLTTIPGVSKPLTDPDSQNACPPPAP